MRVEVYYNLHKHCYSIRALEGTEKGRVVAHMESVCLDDPVFVVQQGGRERVLREKRKNVHAFVRGQWRNSRAWGVRDESELVEVTYNPYKYDRFVRKSDEVPVTKGDYAELQEGRKIVVWKGKFEVDKEDET